MKYAALFASILSVVSGRRDRFNNVNPIENVYDATDLTKEMWEDETPNYVEYFESEADLWAEIKSHDMNYKELWFEFIDATVQSETITVQPNSGVFVFLKHIHPFMVTAGASPESTALDIIGFTDGVDSSYCEDTCVGFALFVPEDSDGEGP